MEANEEFKREVGNKSDNSVHVVPVLENVEALSSKKLKEIPHYYLQPHEAEIHLVEVEDMSKFPIPAIDMTKLLDKHCFGHHDELARLHLACEDWGVFQWPNDFEGYGQAFIFSEEQKLDWGDRLFLVVQPVSIRNLRFWPTDPTSFRENLDKYSLEMQKLTVCLLKFMSRNLGLDPDTLTGMFEEGSQGVRLNLYPPCWQAYKVMGLSPHSDVVQVNDVQRLQIKKNGKWVPANPIPAAFIVNIGDLIEVSSHDQLCLIVK